MAAKIFWVTLASLRDLLKKALVNQVEELRHDGKRRDIAFAQSPQQFCGIESLQVDDSRTLDQRQKQVGHLRQNVK